MTLVSKQDSNSTALRIAEEASVKVLPGTPIWLPFEPNSYSDFGGSVTNVARTPINADRQRKKGVITDLDANGGFNTDLTQVNLQTLLQGYFFADLRQKTTSDSAGAGVDFSNIDAVADEYERASGDFTADGWLAGDLAFASGFDDAANNGLKRVLTSVTLALGVAESLVADASPAADAGKLVQIGFQFAAGDLDVDSAGSLPAITSTAKDLTTLSLIVGETIFIGGDSALLAFTTVGNIGVWARIRSITSTRMEFDKTSQTMATESSTSETVQIFFGRVLKNETGTAIVRRSYQLERTLGAPDDASPAQVQSEYVTGAIPNEATFNIPTADKLNVDLTFIGLDNEQRTGVAGVKSGTRPALVEDDAFNTSSDISRIKLSVFTEGSANPTALFAFAQDLTITINNNISPDKAVSVLGGFDATKGTFAVGGSFTVYFADVASVVAVRNNEDITLDLQLVKMNAGIGFDIPLISLGDGRANVELDQAITLPLSSEAASGSKIFSGLNHTMMMVFYDYLPTLADS